MRHLLLALMILLLPLRGWMGDAMATSMAAGQLTVLQTAQSNSAKIATVNTAAAAATAATFATKTIAEHAHKNWAAAHNHSENVDSLALSDAERAVQAQTSHDCGMQAMDAANSDGAANSGADCGTCASCQACHTVALSPTAEKSIAIFNLVALAEAAALPFASADAALSQKPPIS